MEFVELTEQEFMEFAPSHTLANFWQTTNFAHMQQKKGHVSYYVGIRDDQNIIAGCALTSIPVFGKYNAFFAHRGPLIDMSDTSLFDFFHQHLLEFLRKHHCLYFHMDPYVGYVQRDLDGNVVDNGFDNSAIVKHLLSLGYSHEGFTRGIDLNREPRWIYVVPFKDLSAEELLKTMERKTVRSIRKTQKYNIQVSELSRDELSVYDKVIQETEKRRNFYWEASSYARNVYDCFHDDGYVKFLVARMDINDYIHDLEQDLNKNETIVKQSQQRLEKQESPKIRRKMELAQEQVDQLHQKINDANALKESDGEILTLASGMFYVYGKEILCLMSGVYEKYLQFAAPYAMHWHMIQYAIEHNMERYNLYGISGFFEPSAEDYGVYLFKKGFQGEPLELIGDFEYIVSPTAYKIYSVLRKIKHAIKRS